MREYSRDPIGPCQAPRHYLLSHAPSCIIRTRTTPGGNPIHCIRKLRCLLLSALLSIATSAHGTDITLLYTNDIESVYEPVDAFWRDDIEKMGGMPYLATLINDLREREARTLLLDAGDIFTGSLSKATGGKLAFDIYSEMGYDAVNLGNHEFEYGWRTLHEVMPRARFPVLNANIFFDGTEVSFGQPYAILQTDGVRVGVIGSMGMDAFLNTMMVANRQGLYARPPAEVLQPIIDRLRPEVDLLVLLTHQNRTAPMQTNKESDPEVQRGIDEDYALAGALRGVDLIIGGHSDNGLEAPVIHPETGTLIVMTYGQGMHLGYARFQLTNEGATLADGRLIPVDAGKLKPDAQVSALIASARDAHPELTQAVTRLDKSAPRQYYRESTVGNLLADLMRSWSGADIAMMPAGAIRADLPGGAITVEDVLNVFPFTDRVSVIQVPATVLLEVLEKSLALEYGLSQFSNIKLTYRSSAPVGERLVDVMIGGHPLQMDAVYTLATGSFTATGGENYAMFKGLEVKTSDVLVSAALISELQKTERQRVPARGRQVDLDGR